jgi:hypothetical protein
MKNPFVIFWALLVVSSIAWYGFLVFYVGLKAGREILALIASLQTGQEHDAPP